MTPTWNHALQGNVKEKVRNFISGFHKNPRNKVRTWIWQTDRGYSSFQFNRLTQFHQRQVMSTRLCIIFGVQSQRFNADCSRRNIIVASIVLSKRHFYLWRGYAVKIGNLLFYIHTVIPISTPTVLYFLRKR